MIWPVGVRRILKVSPISDLARQHLVLGDVESLVRCVVVLDREFDCVGHVLDVAAEEYFHPAMLSSMRMAGRRSSIRFR